MSQTTTAVFLFIGFDAERRQTPGQPFPELDNGFFSIPETMDDMATLVETWYDKAAAQPDFEGLGCFDYEITEEMGAWLYRNFEATGEEFTAALEGYVAAWRLADEARARQRKAAKA